VRIAHESDLAVDIEEEAKMLEYVHFRLIIYSIVHRICKDIVGVSRLEEVVAIDGKPVMVFRLEASGSLGRFLRSFPSMHAYQQAMPLCCRVCHILGILCAYYPCSC
jgi:hypothetical protein